MSYLRFGITSSRLRADFAGIQQVSSMSDEGRINPLALSIPDAVRLLSKAGGRLISLEQIEADVAAGAPQNGDGTINLITYAAWLAKERSHGD